MGTESRYRLYDDAAQVPAPEAGEVVDILWSRVRGRAYFRLRLREGRPASVWSIPVIVADLGDSPYPSSTRKKE